MRTTQTTPGARPGAPHGRPQAPTAPARRRWPARAGACATLIAALAAGCTRPATTAPAPAPAPETASRAVDAQGVAATRPVDPAPVLTPGPAPAADRSEPEPIVIGVSRQGRPIHVLTLGSGPTRVLLIGLIHGHENEGYEHFGELWGLLGAAGLGSAYTIHAIPSMNPDGYASRTRGNASGVDLNRNWPASNFAPRRSRGPAPLSEPESRAVHAHIERFAPDLIVVFHSASSGPFVDPDGPGEAAARAFVDAAAGVDPRWRYRPDFTNPPGSLGSYFGLDLGRPILTVEFRAGQDTRQALRSAHAGFIAAIRAMGEGESMGAERLGE